MDCWYVLYISWLRPLWFLCCISNHSCNAWTCLSFPVWRTQVINVFTYFFIRLFLINGVSNWILILSIIEDLCCVSITIIIGFRNVFPVELIDYLDLPRANYKRRVRKHSICLQIIQQVWLTYRHNMSSSPTDKTCPV